MDGLRCWRIASQGGDDAWVVSPTERGQMKSSTQPTLLNYAGRSAPDAVRRRWRVRHFLGIFMAVLATYAASYAVAQRYRAPAMNLRYYVYDTAYECDYALYILFYPAYRVHKWMAGPEFVNTTATGPRS
jgi:hypothetical protein